MDNNKAHYYRVIYIYDARIHPGNNIYHTLFRFTCSDCINRGQCRHNLDNVLRCPVEYDLCTNKKIRSVHVAKTRFGNQYFILNNMKATNAICEVFKQYIK